MEKVIEMSFQQVVEKVVEKPVEKILGKAVGKPVGKVAKKIGKPENQLRLVHPSGRLFDRLSESFQAILGSELLALAILVFRSTSSPKK